VTFENYDDMNYGYLRVIATAAQLRIEYHPASDSVGVKAPDDSITIDVKSRRQAVYSANDLGLPARAQEIRDLRQSSPPRPANLRTKRTR
jgi:hypothetical protein